jgi:Protein of unknown function (DUF4058)
MPLRDHFLPPLDEQTSWEGFHGGWPMMIVQALQRRLPKRYVAAPRVHLGSMIEIDIATYDQDELSEPLREIGDGGVAVISPPTLTAATDLPAQDDYEVLVHDMKRSRRLVAAIEIVSPAHKDRPEHRRVFVAKCASLLRQGVSVAIVDLVTTRNFDLYADLLALIGIEDPKLGTEPPSIYASACRWTIPKRSPIFEAWSYRLEIGQPLPTLPIWLSDEFRVPLELEPCYEETCRILRIP